MNAAAERYIENRIENLMGIAYVISMVILMPIVLPIAIAAAIASNSNVIDILKELYIDNSIALLTNTVN